MNLIAMYLSVFNRWLIEGTIWTFSSKICIVFCSFANGRKVCVCAISCAKNQLPFPHLITVTTEADLAIKMNFWWTIHFLTGGCVDYYSGMKQQSDENRDEAFVENVAAVAAGQRILNCALVFSISNFVCYSL